MSLSYQTILFKEDNGIAIITLNRPQVRNAINDQMADELASAIAGVAKDEKTRVLIITGSGPSFCAGADFRFGQVRAGGVSVERAEDLQFAHRAISRGHLLHKLQSGTILALQRLDKPTIAMVNGDAVGAGFDLCLACDLRVSSANARFMVAYTRMAVVPDGGGTWLLPRVVGLGKALELIFTADFCDAEEAYRIGMLNRLVPHEELEKTTMDLALRIAKGPPISHRLSKVLIYKGLETDLETALQFLSACIPITIASEDHKEAVRAFAEKRSPMFEGK